MSITEQLLNTQPFSRIRRNHGLEHATLHVLAKRYPGKRMAGHSDLSGFWIIADLAAQEIKDAAEEALQRLSRGEHKLAVHPNCGTNFATAGSLAGLAGVFGMLGVGSRKRDKLERLPMVAVLGTLALIAAQPLGMKVQQHFTTSGNPGALEIIEISETKRGRFKACRIITKG